METENLGVKLLKHLYSQNSYWEGKGININDFLLENASSLTGIQLRNILVNLLDSNYINDIAKKYAYINKPITIEKLLKNTEPPCQISAKLTKDGYEYINNLTIKNTSKEDIIQLMSEMLQFMQTERTTDLQLMSAALESSNSGEPLPENIIKTALDYGSKIASIANLYLQITKL
ncbi:MAG TPA: hypothetical protein VN026_11030 [Bacteroidia bacterium]|jgi:hypothetical protein|nr:hypothetical protein [Bacteroidia bacterium]